ncbi:MAG: hypothetical protein GX621_14395 [Pirellulaceae bacterium]|nr:hypothetical protein [Pirellulaceae bacterium]
MLAASLATVTFGGLVTTYDAAMAVPDWPNTFGRFVLFYPPQEWLAHRDLFLQHGHRLLGFALVALTAVVAALLWKTDRRPAIRWLGWAALALVCLQAFLGGLRVLTDEILVAKFLAGTAPLFVALAAAIVTCTSSAWHGARKTGVPAATAARLHRWTFVALPVVYVQIVLGAQLRHVPHAAGVGWFAVWLWLHLIAAATVTVLVVGLLAWIRRRFAGQARLRRRAGWLAALVLGQLALGAAVWITNYNWPVWFTDWFWTPKYTVTAYGFWQVTLTTAHVAAGMLGLAASLSLALWSRRLVGKDDIMG